ncbi:hypothetical protein BH09VER1_BH09VER1_02410 [soil metagenome]
MNMRASHFLIFGALLCTQSWMHADDDAPLSPGIAEAAKVLSVKDLAWVRPLAENGNAAAQFRMVVAYLKNEGVKPDEVEAAFWYRKCAERGMVDFQYALGKGYQEEYHDSKEALYWLRKAAEQGHGDAQMRLAFMLPSDGPDVRKTERYVWLERAAEQGNVQARVSLIYFYEKNPGYPLDHANWLDRSAEAGDASAQFRLGRFLEFAKLEVGQALYWYEKSAEKGEARAQNNLGELYATGNGVKRDDAMAFYWYDQAARQRLHIGYYNIAVFYRDGRAVKRDLALAEHYFRCSARLGYPPALAALVPFVSQSHPEIREAVAGLAKFDREDDPDSAMLYTEEIANNLPND